MKKQSKLGALPAEDQKRILELCDQHTYDEVVPIVAKSRDQGGLDLKTNRSALSRFNRDHGTVSANGYLASQFLDLLNKSPVLFDELLSSLTHLIGQSAFVLVAQNRPFDEYRRQVETLLRLERVCRERERFYDERDQLRQSAAQAASLASTLSSLNALKPQLTPQPPSPPNSNPVFQSGQPATPPPNPISLDFTLPSFKTPLSGSPASNPQPGPNNIKPPQPATVKFPELSSIFSDLSSKTPGNLTNLTKSHITTAPSMALPRP